MDTVIAVEGLHKRYGDTVAVADISFAVRRGEIFGLLGSNGAGKTTTVEAVQGLRARDRGHIEVLGIDPARSAGALRGRIGSQLQSSALPDRMRVGEAIRLFASGLEAAVDIDATLRAWDLTTVRRRAFAALSGGQRQRLFLALAMLGHPEVVVLDELTTGLDPQARRATWELVREVRDRGATVVLVTHFMEEAEVLCDRVAIVDGGRIVALDTPAALIAGRGNGVTLTFSGAGHDVGFLSYVPGVDRVSTTNGLVTVTAAARAAAPVAASLADHGISPPDFRTHHPTLEDVFLAVSGRTLQEQS
jgi:ABC-2 type transport system ATP-binding protein